VTEHRSIGKKDEQLTHQVVCGIVAKDGSQTGYIYPTGLLETRKMGRPSMVALIALGIAFTSACSSEDPVTVVRSNYHTTPDVVLTKFQLPDDCISVTLPAESTLLRVVYDRIYGQILEASTLCSKKAHEEYRRENNLHLDTLKEEDRDAYYKYMEYMAREMPAEVLDSLIGESKALRWYVTLEALIQSKQKISDLMIEIWQQEILTKLRSRINS
jgi:hypothetical protein